MKKRVVICIVICIVLILNGIIGFAADQTMSFLYDNNDKAMPDIGRIGEVVELRTVNSETYKLENGAYECIVYMEPKYYNDPVKGLVPIDNTIVKTPGNNHSFQNLANNMMVSFGEENELEIKITSGKDSISFSPIGANYVSARLGGLKGIGIFEEELFGDNYIAYPGVFENSDLVYSVHNGLVKEYIVLYGPDSPANYSFQYNIQGYKVVLGDQGKVSFYNKENEEVFKLGDLFAVDSYGKYTDSLKYSMITVADDIIQIDISLDKEYIDSPERCFPIIIDPSVMLTGEYSTYDTFVSSSHPTTNYYLNKYLRTGKDGTFGTRRSYIKFDIPSYLNNVQITNAYINIRRYSDSVPTIKAYRVTSSWSSNSITWNVQPAWDSGNWSGVSTLASNNWYHIDVTMLTQSWVLGTYSNYGVILKEPSETSGKSTVFYSSDAASPNKPELNITYAGDPYYGSRPYQFANIYDCNPVGYALEYNPSPDNYDLNLSDSIMQGKTKEEIASIVAQNLSSWMSTNIGSGHYGSITTYNSTIDAGWFRVVVRVGMEEILEDGYYQAGESWDYHLWYQTNENQGQWAHKRDLMTSEVVSGSSASTNPGSFINQWIVHGMNGDIVCDGVPRYYKIHDIRSNQW